LDGVRDLLAVALLPGVSPRLVGDLRRQGLLREVLEHPEAFGDLLSEAALGELSRGASVGRAERELGRARAEGIRIVGLDDPDYPVALAQTYDPPPVLYVRGTLLPAPAVASVAVVGSRAASPGGRAFARGLGRDLAAAGIEVVSGLARGIDGEAHRGALEAPGRTVAVLGSALDRLYPPEHEGLARRIEEGPGAVVSEFPFGCGPLPHHFPRRNRIIAGLAQAVVVVEAAERSGALTTARFALEEGRDVLAVPGHPTDVLAAGTNALLRDGAAVVRSAADVAETLGLVIGVTPATGPSGDDILDSLRRDRPLGLEELQSLCGRPASELLARLSLLELEARVRRLPGPAYVRA
jgi:DNA processing protein